MRTTCGCCNCSSAASSIVTTRSSCRNVARQHVQQRRLAAAGAAGNQDVDLGLEQAPSSSAISGVSVLRLRTRFSIVSGVYREAADRHHRPVQRQRRNDGVDARAVGQPRIDHRAGFVDAAADARHDLVDDFQQVLSSVKVTSVDSSCRAVPRRPAGTCSPGCPRPSDRPSRAQAARDPAFRTGCRVPGCDVPVVDNDILFVQQHFHHRAIRRAAARE